MKSIFTSLAIAVACFIAPAAHAQRVTQTIDVERPTAQNIVSAHCVATPATACTVYTVPAGKILHVTQLGHFILGSPGGLLVWGLNNFTSLIYAMPSGNLIGTDKVDLYLPPGFVVTVKLSNVAPAGMDLSLFGVLSDQ